MFINDFRTLLVCAGVLLVATGCGSGSAGASRASGEIVFKPADVSITVGDGWIQVERKVGPPICTPSLAGKAGMIHALTFEQEFPNPKAAADYLHKSFAENPRAVQDTFREENFTSGAGLAGVHLTYAARSKDDPLGPAQSRSHNFVVQNRAGKLVSINYITDEGKDAEAVAMIRNTLKAQ